MKYRPFAQHQQIVYSPPEDDSTPSCFENTVYRDKYEQIVNAKKKNCLPLLPQISDQYQQDQEKLYLKWKAAYTEAVQHNQKDPLHASIKATFKCQLMTAYFVSFLSTILHIGTAFLMYLIFRNVSLSKYRTQYNLAPILLILAINISRPFLNKYSQQKLNKIGVIIYKIIAQGLIRKSLKVSVLTNKKIPLSQMSKLMHIDCQKILEYPSKYACTVEGVLYFALISSLIIYLAEWAGALSLLSLLFIIIFRYLLKNTIRTKEEELNKHTNIRIKTTIQVFSMIKYIKSNALQSCFFNKLRLIRMKEVQKLREKLFYDVLMIILSVLLRAVAISITMKLIIAFKGSFDISVAFCINLAFGFINFQSIMKNFASFDDTKASLKEIEIFFNLEQMDTSHLSLKPEPSNCAIRIRKGNFEWEAPEESADDKCEVKTKFSLKNINIEVQKGELIALIGTYGSGKTSLVYSLLGQMKNSGESQVLVNGTLAYCCQSAWIMNDTVKNNILFGSTLNQKRYEEALKFSCLEDDLNIFREGDNTVIGEKGSTLSGGQKARISLARALYNNADIYILDDILSAVDAHVGSFIFNQTVKNYLRDKTILLITHSLYFLQHTDRIFVFQDGKIQHQGTYKDLKDTQIFAQVQFTDLKAQKAKQLTIFRNTRMSSINQAVKTKDKDEFEQVMGIGESLSLYIARNSGCTFAVIICFFTILIAFVSSFGKIWTNVWSNSNQQGNNFFIIILVSISLIQSLFVMLLSMTLYKSKIFELLHNDMVRSLLFAPYTYFEATPFDKIVNIFSNQLNANDKIFTSQIILAQFQTQMVLSYVFGIIFVYHIDGMYMHLFYFFLHFAIMIFFYQKYFHLNLKSKQLQQSLLIPISSSYSEVLNGLSTIRSYQKIQYMLQDSFKKMQHFSASSFLRSQIESKLKMILSVATNLYAFIVLGIIYFWFDQIGPLCVFLLFNAFTLEDSATRFHKSTNQLASRLKAFGRCQQMTRIQPERGYADYLTEYYIEDQAFKYYHYPIEIFRSGHIVFQNFSFRYNPQQDDVLKNLTLFIRPAEKVGIVGRTGSGKSTMMLALLRIIQSNVGKIYIDNIDISTLSLQQLRSNINIILQDHFLFTGSLRQNVDPSQVHSNQEIINSLKLCGIWNIFQAKQGLETLISEGGNNLSSGEKQLINICRSLLNPKKVVLIDEATASIDLQTDSLIQKVIKKQFYDKTVLTIAHRINTVLDSDRIMVLSEGRIVEFDTPKNLLANENSLFAKLYKESGKNKVQ